VPARLMGSVIFMDILNAIWEYFKKDPHKLLLWVGGSGGVLYWINLYRFRTRIEIRDLKEHFFSNDCYISFEAENLGNAQTSILPEIKIKALTHKRVSFKCPINIEETDRILSSCSPKRFRAILNYDNILLSLFYKQYSFGFTRGFSKRIYIQSANEKMLSWYNFLREKTLFKFFGKHPWVNR